MKHVLVVLFSLYSTLYAQAQTPRFSWSSYPDSTKLTTLGFISGPVRWQSIYYPANFSSAPSGKITNIYFRAGRNGGRSPVIYNNITVKLGYASKAQFSGGIDSFIAGLTTVFAGTNYTVAKGDSEGAWIRLPTSAGEFYYDKNRNFVVEISQKLPSSQNGFDLFATNRTSGIKRTQSGYPDSADGSGGGAICLDFGFDIIPNSVAGVSNIVAVSIFPNPSHGPVTVELQGRQPLSNVRLSLCTVTGQEVFQQSYHPTASAFSTEIAPGRLPTGMYFLKMEADGEIITRKLLVE